MKLLVAALALTGMAAMAGAEPVFVGGLVLSGALADATAKTDANDGRFGFFSDMAYDPASQSFWALSDRGPGGGTIPYEARLSRFTIKIDPKSGAISHFRIVETVKLSSAGVPFNGLMPDPPNSTGVSLDPEGLAIDPKTGNFYIAEEYGPSVYEFDRQGEFVRAFETPSNIVPRNARGLPNFSSDEGNVAGRKANRGFEGLTITPDGRFLFAILQSAMVDEGGKYGSVNRIVKFDIATGKSVAQYPYRMEGASQGRGTSAILALDDHRFLVLERNNRGLGVGSDPRGPVKRIFKIDLTGATEISSIVLAPGVDFTPVQKTLWLDLGTDTLPGLANKVPEKFESFAFGPRLEDGSVLLLAGTDNDYSVTQNGPGTQFDTWYDLSDDDPAASAIECKLGEKTGCFTAKDRQPAKLKKHHVLLPGVLMAYRVPADDLSGNP